VGPNEDQDVGVDRQGDLANWRRRDPIGRLAAALLEQGSAVQGDLDGIAAGVDAVIEQAWTRALADPLPPAAQLLDCVYASTAGSAA
jgi:TPP-dependent pyruvate/acetoin dehydrogenase alpha subunit